MVQTKQFEVNEFFTYGKCFNFSGILPGIAKDNFESAKLYLTNGNGYEKTYKLNNELKDGNLVISTTDVINNGLILDDLEEGKYVSRNEIARFGHKFQTMCEQNGMEPRNAAISAFAVEELLLNVLEARKRKDYADISARIYPDRMVIIRDSLGAGGDGAPTP